MPDPKIVVTVKQVSVASDELEIVDGRVPDDALGSAVNEWDLHATEEAIRLREALGAGEVVVITVGGQAAETALRRCLAMGADRAIRIDAQADDPISIAWLLADHVADEAPALVLTGVQSSDSVQGATGTALAELLGVPVAAVVREITWSGEGPARVQRELEGGLVEVVELDTPALLTMQTGINEPQLRKLARDQAGRAEGDRRGARRTGHDPAYRVVRQYLPQSESDVELLQGDEASIATRILELVRERVA